MSIDQVRDQEIQETKQYRTIAAFIADTALTRLRQFELAVLVLTVLTTGSLWSASATQFPEVMYWVGAILSTVLTLITVVIKWRNYDSIARNAIDLQHNLNNLLTEYTAKPDMPRSDYRAKHKKLEDDCRTLEITSGIHRLKQT